jgi:hypothetical protein
MSATHLTLPKSSGFTEHGNATKTGNRNAGKLFKNLLGAAACGTLNAQNDSAAKWRRLVAFGQYAHPKGMQVVSRESAYAMIDYFNSLRGKLMRKFLGLPIYIGHPDDHECVGTRDRTVYGRIEDLKIEGDALWALLRWTKLGKKLFSGGFLRHLSPRWMMRKIGDRIFQPMRLISIGMTNHPNLCDKSGFTAAECAKCSPLPANAESEICGENEIKNSAKNTVSGSVPCAELFDGRSEVSAEDGAPSSVEHTDSDGRGSGGGGLHIDSLTKNLSKRSSEQSRMGRILALVHEQMINFGDDYQSAWSAVKRRFPALFREKF